MRIHTLLIEDSQLLTEEKSFLSELLIEDSSLLIELTEMLTEAIFFSLRREPPPH